MRLSDKEIITKQSEEITDLLSTIESLKEEVETEKKELKQYRVAVGKQVKIIKDLRDENERLKKNEDKLWAMMVDSDLGKEALLKEKDEKIERWKFAQTEALNRVDYWKDERDTLQARLSKIEEAGSKWFNDCDCTCQSCTDFSIVLRNLAGLKEGE